VVSEVAGEGVTVVFVDKTVDSENITTVSQSINDISIQYLHIFRALVFM